jgi:predicted permease
MVAVRLLVPATSDYLSRIAGAGMDVRVLGFSVALTLLTTLVVSLPPARRIARVDVDGSLRDRPRGDTDAHGRVRSTLVVVQIAMGLILTSGATLLATNFVHLMNRDLGFRPADVLTFNIGLPGARYPTNLRVEFVNTLLDRLKALPAVASASAGMPLPLMGDEMTVAFNIQERPSAPSSRPFANMAIVTPDYFRTIATPLIAGREFSERDDDNAPPVLIVNQAFADRFFPGEQAVGKWILPGATSSRGPLVRQIVGIVGNARQSSLGPRPEPIYYFPFKQLPWGPPFILIRTTVPPHSLEPAVRDLVASLDKSVPLSDVRSLDDMLVFSMSGPRIVVLLMGAFAVMALLLTAVGLYGVLAYSVMRRTREIGVRIALGANRGSVVTMVLRRALVLVLIGGPIGLAGALAVTRLLTHLIAGRASFDAVPLLLTCALMALTAGIAAYLPARRAASIDPTRALRAE